MSRTHLARTSDCRRGALRPGQRGRARSGSTIVVVIALMGLLALLGFTFVTFTNQELGAASNFAESTKRTADPTVDPNDLFDYALRQLIAGTDNPNSALFGGRHSLVPNLLGRDVYPHSGEGVHVIADPTTGDVFVDQDYDGTADGSNVLLEINDSPQARLGNLPGFAFPDPDVDYTYPDINNVFLAYRGKSIDGFFFEFPVIIPSFHRPQYLRWSGVPIVNWETSTSPDTSRLILRPHAAHQYVNPASGPPYAVLGPRYVTNAATAQALGLSGPFPIADPTVARHGVWSLGPWQASTYYRIGQLVQTPGGVYECVQAGTSGSTSPSWTGATVTDNSVVWQQVPNPPPPYAFEYEFDADPDGDGIKEAVWLDLGHPPIERPDGKFVVPLFAFTVYDADGLLNLNVHGNAARRFDPGPDNVFGTGDEPVQRLGSSFGGADGGYISESNQGISPAEVNLLRALDANPDATVAPFDLPSDRPVNEIFRAYLGYYGHVPVTATEAANMDWWFALTGRPIYQSSGAILDLVPGRWGDLNRLAQVIGNPTASALDYPQPGVAFRDIGATNAADDNGNAYRGFGNPPFGHPLDVRGLGRFFNPPVSGTVWQPLFFDAPTDTLNRWPKYENVVVQMVDPVSGSQRAVARWGTQSSFAGQLATWSSGTAVAAAPGLPNIDDEAETIVDLRFERGRDAVFEPAECFALQASDKDRKLTGLGSRLLTLMSWNLRDNLRAKEIRERFTTVSNDSVAFSRPFHDVVPPGTMDARRAQEFQPVGGGVYQFPPNHWAGTGKDPFRPELRQWLTLRHNDPTASTTGAALVADLRQRRLSLNGLVDVDASGRPYIRPLRPHPQTVPSGAFVPMAERDARIDRQRLARDIYVLLYFFGGRRDDVDYFTTPNGPNTPGPHPPRKVYSDEELREMAQFAVNFVDALDPDDVITKFEYDKDLSDGWDLNDDPYDQTPPVEARYPSADQDPLYPEDGPVRGVVYGVEAQTLTLSEAMVVKALQVTDAGGAAIDHRATQWDDRKDRYFTYVELRNASPFPVSFSRANGAQWALEVVITDGANSKEFRREVQIWRDDLSGPIPGGGLFTILSLSDDHMTDPMSGTPLPSHIEIDLNATMADLMDPTYTPNYTRIAPRVNTAGAGVLALDLIRNQPTPKYFELFDPDNPAMPPAVGEFIYENVAGHLAPGGNDTITFILKRRLHPGWDSVSTADPNYSNYDTINPWVEVDRMTIHDNHGLWFLEVRENDDGAAIRTTLTDGTKNRKSWERIEPLARRDPLPAGLVLPKEYKLGAPPALLPGRSNAEVLFPDPNPIPPQRNTLGQDNRSSLQTGQRFSLWQMHFDRDFASPAELFVIPLYGPRDLTRGLDLPGTWTVGRRHFLERVFSRWARVLEFFEYPSAWHRQGNPAIPDYRHPGRINWNTIRHKEVLAALLDDDDVLTVDTVPNDRTYLPSVDNLDVDNFGNLRDWWYAFLWSRDGLDPMTRMILPGAASSRPFRSLAFNAFPLTTVNEDRNGNGTLDPGEDLNGNGTLDSSVQVPTPLEATMLRSLPMDLNDPVDPARRNNPRQLFEVVKWADHNTDTVDFLTRHHLLSRVLNNSTTRSNVFFVFVQVDFFEAYVDPTNGYVGLGARAADVPSRRGFFVIDRSLALEKIRSSHFGPVPPGPYRSYTLRTVPPAADGFDYRSLVLFQQIIE